MCTHKICGNAGFLTVEQLELPTAERLAKGPVAVIECRQNIPCNPCETSCPRNCIRIGEQITNLPQLDQESCIGCGICVASCPGLAIFIEDGSIGGGEGLVSFPYEYLPLPEKGQAVSCVDRRGEYRCGGTVERVVKPPKFDGTAVVTVRIPLDEIHEVRSIARERKGDQ